MKSIYLFVIMLALAGGGGAQEKERAGEARIRQRSLAGETLDVETGAAHPLPPQRIEGDRGVNVLVDLAHQALFATMWRLPRQLRRLGYRAMGSQAALDTVLDPEGRCRVRIRVGGRRPFAWIPNPPVNLVLSHQSSSRAQDYLPSEMAALDRFLRRGGGVVLVGGFPGRGRKLPLNKVAARYGAAVTGERETWREVGLPALEHGPEWEIRLTGKGGRPVLAGRQVGKGRLVLAGSLDLFMPPRRPPGKQEAGPPWQQEVLAGTLAWAAAGMRPAGGAPRLPREAGGGGPIYPELEKRVGKVVVYYAANQKPRLLEAVVEDMPRIKERVEAWLPSRPTREPIHLVLSAGGGGGWAVNAYRPKEVGIISLDRAGILSIFANEQTHTLGGPPNEQG